MIGRREFLTGLLSLGGLGFLFGNAKLRGEEKAKGAPLQEAVIDFGGIRPAKFDKWNAPDFPAIADYIDESGYTVFVSRLSDHEAYRLGVKVSPEATDQWPRIIGQVRNAFEATQNRLRAPKVSV